MVSLQSDDNRQINTERTPAKLGNTTSEFYSDLLKSGNKKVQTQSSTRHRRSNTFSNHFQLVKDQNQQYFDQLLQNLKCPNCQCVKCRCSTLPDLKQEHKRTNLTTNQEFNAKKIRELSLDREKFQLQNTGRDPIKTIDHNVLSQYNEIPDMVPLDYDPFRSETMVELQTTNNSFYKGLQAKDPYQEVTKINRNTMINGYRNLNVESNYTNQFHGQNLHKNIKFTQLNQLYQPSNINTVHITENMSKLQGKQPTQTFKAINFAEQRDRLLQPPIGVQLQFTTDTQYRKTNQDWFHRRNFKSFSHNLQDNRIKNTHVFESIPVYENQYLSTTKRDFIEKKSECSNYLQPAHQTQRLTRKAYMYRQYNETQGKFT